MSAKEIKSFLEKLGLKSTVYYEKRRVVFAYKKWSFEIDSHPKIPPFLEIEGSSPKEIDRAIKLLGLEKYEQSAESIAELLKRKYPKISLNGLVFKG